MANIKITELNAASSLAANDVLPVVDISTDETKKITSTNLFRTLPDGTAAAPALAFSSDQANGIYLAGTDTVGITTGGTQRVTVDASGNVVISGDLTVQGATTTVESTTVTIDDKNIELGSVASPSNTTADGGGITLKGASDKTIKWINSTGCWTFNQPTNFNDHVRIDSSGNVGIGDTTPSGKLEIRGASTVGTNTGHIVLSGDSATVGQGPQIVFSESGSGSSVAGAYIGHGREGSNSIGFLSFGTRSSSDANVVPAERLRIDSSGRLLVGTTSAVDSGSTSGVQVVNTSTAILSLGRNDSTISAGNDVAALRFWSNAGGSYQQCAEILAEADGTYANNDKPTRLVFSTTADGASSPTERVRIDSSGNVGIGTTSPVIPIQLNNYGGLDGNANQLIISNNTYYSSGDKATKTGFSTRIDLTNQDGSIRFLNTAASSSANAAITLQERLRIDSSGNVGIGTSSPGTYSNFADDLVVYNASQPGITLATGTSGYGSIYFADGTVGNAASRGQIQYNHNDDSLLFASAGSERLRIDSSGQLLIGTTSGNGIIRAFGSSGRLIVGDSSINYYDSNTHIFRNYASTERLRIDSSGNVGIGTTSPQHRLSVERDIGIYRASSDPTLSLSVGGTIASPTKTYNLLIDDSDSDKLQIRDGSTARITLDSSGNVGIGTASPGKLLSLQDSTTPSLALYTGSTIRAELKGTSALTSLLSYSNSPITFNIGGSAETEALRIDGSGNVGIGTSSPVGKTYISGPNASTFGVAADAALNLAAANGALVNRVVNLNFACVDSATNAVAAVGMKYTSQSGFGKGDLIFGTRSVTTDTAPTERLRINSSGNVGIGTINPGTKLEINGSIGIARTAGGYTFRETVGGNERAGMHSSSGNDLIFNTGGASEQMRIDSSGRVLVGTSSARSNFTSSTVDSSFQIERTQSNFLHATFTHNDNGATGPYIGLAKQRSNSVGGNTIVQSGDQLGGISFFGSDGSNLIESARVQSFSDGTPGSNDMPGRLVFSTTADGASSPTERMRINSSGKLGLGTDSPSTLLDVRGEISVAYNANYGIRFYNQTRNNWSSIGNHIASGSSAANLVFKDSTGEAMRLAGGKLLVGKTDSLNTTKGAYINQDGQLIIVIKDSGSAQQCIFLNREDSDGTLILFRQGNATEGSISVSGSTVSYNGGHLARWSQLASGAARTEILRGSVLSNLDEMCEWAHAAQDAVLYTEEDELPEGVSVGDVKTPAVDAYTEDNEQLNRMKVSDVEGDKNVSGVFQSWDDDDDTYVNDFYCAMTGDFVIRIAQGTTVARGDLLMSAGDGTAKPQDDDIVRSKTIAKVTSTTVSTTYSDNSYCVPCVLMAC